LICKIQKKWCMKKRFVLIRRFSCTHFNLNLKITLSVIADLPPKVFCRSEHPANKILYNLIVYLFSCTKYRHRFYIDENTDTCPRGHVVLSRTCPLPGALHCAGDSMGGDLRTWWGDAWNEEQDAFLTLILDRMHHRGAYRVLAHHTHTILRSAFGESMELCVWYRSVNYATVSICKRCNYIIMMSCATLSCQTTRSWDDVYHPPSTRCDIHRQIHWSTLCAWYVQHSQEFHTPVQYMCN